jgi:hypothetical protein
MHRPERGCGEGGEDQRVLDDGVGHCLAADHPGSDQVEHVSRVDPRARRAVGVAPVAARHQGDPERLLTARVRGDDRTGGDVDGLRRAVQPDRVRTVADLGQRLGPGVELGRGEQLADPPGSGRIQGGQVQRRVLAVSGEPVRHQVGQGGGQPRASPCGHRLHHPRRACHAAKDPVLTAWHTRSEGPPTLLTPSRRRGPLQRRDTRPAKGPIRGQRGSQVSVCNGYLCVRPLPRVGSRPPGEIAPSVCL